MVFETAEITFRARCAADAEARADRGANGGGEAGVNDGGGMEPRVASWSATFAEGHPTLRDAAATLGLWPDCAPDRKAAAAEAPLLRRPLPDPGGDAVHSLTATVRGGRIVQVTVFDEPPDWL